jgi:hypothetical protein
LKINGDKDERFDVTREFYNSVKEGGRVQLCTLTGKLGYSYVTEFKLANE